MSTEVGAVSGPRTAAYMTPRSSQKTSSHVDVATDVMTPAPLVRPRQIRVTYGESDPR